MKNLGLILYRAFNASVGLRNLAQVKFIVTMGLCLLTLGLTAPAQASEYLNPSGCLKEDYVAGVLKDFDVEFSDSAEDMQIESCNPKSLSYRIALALIFLKHGQYYPGTRSQDQSFENIFATQSPYAFVKKAVRTVKVNDCKRIKFAWAYAIPGSDEINICAKKMNDWDLVSPKKISAVRIASLIVHEVRHLDLTAANHKTTPQCFHCDPDVESKGSFYFEKEFLYNIHKNGKNFTANERNDARFWAEFVLDTNFIKRADLVRPLRKKPAK